MMASCNTYAAKHLGVSTGDIARVSYEGQRVDDINIGTGGIGPLIASVAGAVIILLIVKKVRSA